MESHAVDFAIIGAGFGGSLTALLLNRIGFRVLLLDRGSHPRFAIGESSTPIADLVLRDLAQRYELPDLLPLSRYGTWKATHPELVCGPKRGFSYFQHQPGYEFESFVDHRNELLVAASRDEAHADTHWLRSDVDSFFVHQVQAAGIPYLDQTEVRVQRSSPTWHLVGNRDGSTLAIDAHFLIDATGEKAFLPRALGLNDLTSTLQTNSRAIYGHFEGVVPWNEILAGHGANLDDHPFFCDAAALHHLLEEGWMWQLRFDNSITSAGFVLEATHHRLNSNVSPREEWELLLNRYPSIAKQFASARLVAPSQGLCRTGRLQRLWGKIVGGNWALLPHTAGFVDPFYSAGIAHTICGVERLVHVLEHHWQRESLFEQLQHYESILHSEFNLIDELIHGSYIAAGHFDLFVPFSMLYFAAATTYEQRRMESGFQPERAFLCAEDREFRRIVHQVRQRLLETLFHNNDPNRTQEFFQDVAQAIAPYNIAGLCDPVANNMYRYTAVDLT